MGENDIDGLEELKSDVNEIADQVKDAIDEVNKPIEEPKKERKIYRGKKNFRGLDYIAAQEPKHMAGIKMQVRGCVAWLEGEDKMSYKDVVMMPYAEFMDLLSQFAKATGIEGSSF